MIIFRLIIISFIFLGSCKKEEPEDIISHEPTKVDQTRFSDKYENDIDNYDSVDSISQDYE